jgi:hypothetical protein
MGCFTEYKTFRGLFAAVQAPQTPLPFLLQLFKKIQLLRENALLLTVIYILRMIPILRLLL